MVNVRLWLHSGVSRAAGQCKTNVDRRMQCTFSITLLPDTKSFISANQHVGCPFSPAYTHRESLLLRDQPQASRVFSYLPNATTQVASGSLPVTPENASLRLIPFILMYHRYFLLNLSAQHITIKDLDRSNRIVEPKRRSAKYHTTCPGHIHSKVNQTSISMVPYNLVFTGALPVRPHKSRVHGIRTGRANQYGTDLVTHPAKSKMEARTKMQHVLMIYINKTWRS